MFYLFDIRLFRIVYTDRQTDMKQHSNHQQHPPFLSFFSFLLFFSPCTVSFMFLSFSYFFFSIAGFF